MNQCGARTVDNYLDANLDVVQIGLLLEAAGGLRVIDGHLYTLCERVTKSTQFR
jgi:hypothetical protein